MSRHWSDVAVMSGADRFANDKLSLGLLETVVRFKQIYFNYGKMKEMLPVDALSFDELLGKLDALEKRLNVLRSTS
jgi:hypothetical protein